MEQFIRFRRLKENGSFVPRIKVSETVEKITNPGLKQVYRIFGDCGQAVADLITGAEEEVDLTNPYRYVDPEKPWKNRHFENCTAKKLQKLIVKKRQTYSPSTISGRNQGICEKAA